MGKVSAMQCKDHARGTLSTANISNLWVHQTNRQKKQQRKARNFAPNQRQQCAAKEFESDCASPHEPSTSRTVLECQRTQRKTTTGAKAHRGRRCWQAVFTPTLSGRGAVEKGHLALHWGRTGETPPGRGASACAEQTCVVLRVYKYSVWLHLRVWRHLRTRAVLFSSSAKAVCVVG